MDTIHARRTIKSYRPDPVPRHTLDELFEAARWAPNHRLNQPWRFRVLGPQSLDRLKTASGGGAEKLMRAPTLVVATFIPSDIELHAREDMQAASCAVYALLLAATDRGLASYWRTPGVLRTPEGRDACAIPDNEEVLGLIHLGWSDEAPPAPDRAPIEEFVTYLD